MGLIIVIVLVCLMIYGAIPESDKKKRDTLSNVSYIEDTSSAFFSGTGRGFGHDTILKIILIEERGAYCEECGEDGPLHVHHIIPISKGGSNEIKNLKLLCYKCHLSQHHHNFEKTGSNLRRKVPDKYEKIGKAFHEKKKLQIKYQANNGEITTRIISPKEIVEKKGIYYIEAFCYLRNEERIFRISRIKNVKIMED